jgi:SAM-dependent methyltransferase
VAEPQEPLASPVYTLGTSPAEQERLHRQSRDLRPHTVALLEHVELPVGGRAIDLGCGVGGVLDVLSQRVGPRGRVVGLEYDSAHIASARAFAADRRLANVEVMQGDARSTGLPSESFDLAHARLLLVNIPRPREVVEEMLRLVRPGGWVACQEADFLGLCDPPHPAWERLSELFVTVYKQDGADAHCGRSVSRLLRDAGLVDIGVEAHADAYPVGHSWRTVVTDLVETLTPKILDRGLADPRELDGLRRAATEHVADPATVVVSFLLFLVWGRKPPSRPGPAEQSPLGEGAR